MKDTYYKIKKITLLLSGLFIISGIYSQSLQIFNQTPLKDNPEIKNDTPSIGQLLRSDNIDMNEYLGVPNISIPLCNMKLSDIDIPLIISYQATGLKVNQDASCVGIGWDLNNLGSVVQIIRGDDDMNPYHHPYLYRLLPDYYSSNYPDFAELPEGGYNSAYPIKTDGYPIEPIQEKYGYRTVFRDYFPINGKLVMNSQFRYSTTYWDSEPDIFIINILGEKLHCVTSDFPKNITQGTKSSKVTVLNKVGYKVKADPIDDTWVVTDPHGTRFYFGLKQSFISYTHNAVSMVGVTGDSGSSSNNKSSNTWYLTKIETALGTTVELLYNTSEEVEFITEGNGTIEYITSQYQENYDPGYPPIFFTNIFYQKAPISYNTVLSKTKEKQYALSEISSKKGRIKFNYTDREDIPKYKKIETITFSFGENDPVKIINFAYDHKLNAQGGKRLFLNSLNVNGELYSFKYDQTQLPSRNSFAQDYWGYYNGSENNRSLVPNPIRFGHKINESHEGSYGSLTNNMSANLKYTKAGILEKIIYPTNGSVEFEYELNTFKNLWVPNYTGTNLKNSNSEGFGLRIKSIIHRDYNSKILKKKTYQYYGGKSVIYHQFDKEGNIEWITSLRPHFSLFARFRAMSTSSLSDVNPFSTHTGIGYDSVSCIFENISNNEKYKTTTHYHNMHHYSSSYHPVTRGLLHTIHMPSFENSSFPKNGLIKEKNYYNTLEQLIQKEEYQYENKKSTLFYGAKLMKIQDVYSGTNPESGSPYSPGITRYLLAYYPIFDFESLLSKKAEKSYNNNQMIETITTYEYNPNRLISNSSIINSHNKAKYRYFGYPTDFSNTDIYQMMINRNILSPIIKERSIADNKTITEEITTNYTKSSTSDLILPNSIQMGSLENNNLRTNITFDRYDGAGNVLQTTTLTGLNTVYIRSYAYQYIVAEIKGVTYDQVKTALGVPPESLSSAIEPNTNLINSLRAKLPNALVTTYTYKPLVGMTSATDPRGAITYYDYDTSGRLKETYIIENGVKKIIQVNDYHYQNQ